MANNVNLDPVAKGSVSYTQQLAKARPGCSPGYMYLSATAKPVIAFYPFSTISFNELVQT
ncbi:hypothetical protein [Spirosoma aerolatum]|uniref:hypothetical protein n=1 Tax=Spirosoma aerolatum TaxID=1211326 RepID=UPI0009ABC9FC|nr:hypothetical protein [Spirosoma aerolatum]